MSFTSQLKYYYKPEFRGGLVIESDDGYVSDYEAWFQTVKHYRQKNPWVDGRGSRIVPINVAPNSSQVGKEGRMTVAQLKELESFGWEVMNHGKTHTRLSAHTVSAPLNVGDTRILIDVPDRVRGIFTYNLTGGGKSEVVTVKPYIEGTNYIDIDQPLVNAYPAGSTLGLTDESLRIECLDGLNELLAMGLNVRNHVVPYHMYNANSQSIIGERHSSSRTVTNGFNDGTTSLKELKAHLIGGLNFTQIESMLDEVYRDNKFLIVYGHGERSNEMIGKLDFLVRKAIEKNVPILTRQQAVEKFYKQ